MALSYNLPSDSTNIIPMTLGAYKYSTTLYSSDNETIGKRYEDIVRYYGETVKRVPSDVENGIYVASRNVGFKNEYLNL